MYFYIRGGLGLPFPLSNQLRWCEEYVLTQHLETDLLETSVWKIAQLDLIARSENHIALENDSHYLSIYHVLIHKKLASLNL